MSSPEDSLIARYFKPLASDPGAFDLTDDAAILKSSADDVVVTTDAIVEGVHFFRNDPPDTIARKALRVNLSDLAAKGATPAGFVLTLALRDADDAWLAPFARALGEDAATFECPLLGGDTVSTPGPLMISITAFGRVLPGRMIRRAGAEPGDRVVVTGTIGDAALGLDILKGGAAAAALAGDAAARDELVGALSHSAAARRPCAGDPRSRYRGDGCFRRSGGRSGQAVRGIGRIGCDRRAEHSVVGGVKKLLAARRRNHRGDRIRRRRLRDSVHDPGESLRGVCPGRRSRRHPDYFDWNRDRGIVHSPVYRRQRR